MQGVYSPPEENFASHLSPSPSAQPRPMFTAYFNYQKLPARSTLNKQGFTLIELLIAVAIIAILSQMAIPSFTQFITKVRRGDAHHLLDKNAHLLERCLTLRGKYNDGCDLWTTSEDGHYTLTSTVTNVSYTLTATPVSGGSQSNDTACTTFVLSHSGHRTATGDNPDICW